jgi:hypothetical protein
MKSAIQPIRITLALFCCGLLPRAQAVNPPPDGGYPGFNTAEGQKALDSLTTGIWNTAIGGFSLKSNTDGSYNTAVGTAALLFNVGNQNTGAGTLNTAIGAAALLSNTTGRENTAVGTDALLSNTSGLYNTALGVFTLQSNHAGLSNTAAGHQALHSNDSSGNGLGSHNSAFGAFALVDNTNGEANSAFGTGAMEFNQTGLDNVAVGTDALELGRGSNNTALGFGAGLNQDNGSGNVYIGAGMFGVAGESNACYIASIFGQTSASGIPVFINSSNKLGTTTSSKRFKEDIKPMEKTSEALYALKPVSFRYKKEIDPAGMSQLGLVTEDVEKVDPDLVVRDKEGKAYTVRYDQVNAMLLNEFLKEHRKVQEQEATIMQLRQQVENLVAHSKEQDAEIRRVRDQVQLNSPARRVASENP